VHLLLVPHSISLIVIVIPLFSTSIVSALHEITLPPRHVMVVFSSIRIDPLRTALCMFTPGQKTRSGQWHTKTQPRNSHWLDGNHFFQPLSLHRWTSAFLLAVYRLCGVIEGRLSHFPPCWLRMGWQSVTSQETLEILRHSWKLNPSHGEDRQWDSFIRNWLMAITTEA